MSGPPNVVLIVLDTTRADAVYPIETNERMPFLKEFSKGCIVFKNAVAPASWTVPSHASIFTGVYPSRNGVVERVDGEIPNYSDLFERYEGDTLAESLSKRGYKTIGFSQNLLIAPDTSFSRGFDEFYYTHNPNQDTYFRMLETYNKILKEYGASFRTILPNLMSIKKSLSFLKLYMELRRNTRLLNISNLVDKGGSMVVDRIKRSDLTYPFFLFINLMEMHDPHDRNSLNLGWSDSFFRETPLPDKIKEDIRGAYFNSASYVDKLLEELVSFLKDKNILENTILLITSDHGQSLFEIDNFYAHGTFLYDELIKVPLILRLPGDFKFQVREGYQSLTRIKQFILDSVDYGNFYDSITEEFVYSESFGSLDKDIAKYSKHPKYRTVLSQIDRRRLAVFYRDFKLIIDRSENIIEEFTKSSLKVNVNDHLDTYHAMKENVELFSWNQR